MLGEMNGKVGTEGCPRLTNGPPAPAAYAAFDPTGQTGRAFVGRGVRREKEEEIKRLVKAIKTGSLEIESIERELRQLEKEKKTLEGEIEGLNIYIRREESKLIDLDIVQRTYQGFSQFYPGLQPKEQHQFLQRLIKEMAIYGDRVKMNLFEVPEIAISMQNSHGLCEPSNWLPGPDSNQRQGG